MIRKVGANWRVVSHTTGRNLGTYTSRKLAENRLKQVQMFKHMHKRK